MDPALLAPLVPITAIIAFAAVKIARMRLTAAGPADVTARLDAVEQRLEGVQQELAEAHERLDFAERLLTKAGEERRLGS